MSVDHYENFPVASWLCPAALRPPVRAIYHFARCADDIADEGDAPADERLRSLGRYRQSLEATLVDHAPPDAMTRGTWAPIFRNLHMARVTHSLPAQPLRDLLSAFEQDVRNPPYVDRASLLDYCARSANPVGRLMLHLFDVHDATSLDQSDAICSALQLINFWQDLSLDVPRGRFYVPQTDLARHGLDRDALRGGDTPATQALVADLVAWARALMVRGAPLARRVRGRAGWELRFVVQGGLRVLDKIAAHDHRVLTWRPQVSAADAPAIAWRALTMPRDHDTPPALRDAA